MRKLFIALLLIAALAVSAVGCSKDGSDGSGSSAGDGGSGAAPAVTVLRESKREMLDNATGEVASSFRYEYNEYGILKAVNVIDASGETVGNNITVKENKDDNGRLSSYAYEFARSGRTTYFFTYNDSGKLASIEVKDKDENPVCSLKYADSEADGTAANAKYIFVDYKDYNGGSYSIKQYDAAYNEVGLRIYEGYDVIYDTISREYNDNNQLVAERFIKKGSEYDCKNEYNESGLLVRRTGAIQTNVADSPLYFEDTYTYDANGNLLKFEGRESSDYSVVGEGRIYDHEEHTSDEYDEQGNTPGQYTYEYYEDGSLKKQTSSGGSFEEYDKDGNVIAETTVTGISYYGFYPIVDDDLLKAYYEFSK